MPPVHAHEVDRTVDAVRDVEAERLLEEAHELGLAHLAARHGELFVVVTAETGDVALDGDVVGRVDEHGPGPLVSEEPFVGELVQGVPTKEAVGTDGP